MTVTTARKATPRDILTLHQKEWEVLACARELNEHSPRVEQTEALQSRNTGELRCLSRPGAVKGNLDPDIRLHLQSTPDIAGNPREGNRNPRWIPQTQKENTR